MIAAVSTDTARIEAFSDGVFAIAITLLVLDLKVPRELHEGQTLTSALAHQWPAYVAFVTSFLTILVMWINHHRMFTLIGRADDRLLIFNGLLLLGITVVPFPTSLVAEYLGQTVSARRRWSTTAHSSRSPSASTCCGTAPPAIPGS